MKPTKTWQEMKKEWLSDPEFANELEESEREFAQLDYILAARAEAGLTQAQVAARMGTTQSAVARIESGLSTGHWPSMRSLQRYAEALGKRLEVRFV